MTENKKKKSCICCSLPYENEQYIHNSQIQSRKPMKSKTRSKLKVQENLCIITSTTTTHTERHMGFQQLLKTNFKKIFKKASDVQLHK